jgi:hypothetical protein
VHFSVKYKSDDPPKFNIGIYQEEKKYWKAPSPLGEKGALRKNFTVRVMSA